MAAALQFAEQAEKFADSAARHLTEDPRDMRIAEVSAGIAQAYAALSLAEVQRAPGANVRTAAVDAGVSPVGRETRESVLVRIGMQMPTLWDWGRLQDECAGTFGVPIEDASLRELKQILKRLVDIRWAQDGVTCPF